MWQTRYLQTVENKIDELRTKQGRDAAFRQSTLIMTSDFDIMAAMRECSIDDKSERSSLSEGQCSLLRLCSV